MRLYTVHERPVALGQDRDVVLVKEGFCWPALLVAPLWALYHRLWLGLVVYLAAAAGIGYAAEAAPIGGATVLALGTGFALLAAFEANDWRRRALERRGYRLLGVVAERDFEGAERRVLTRAATPPPRARPAAPEAPPPPAAAPS